MGSLTDYMQQQSGWVRQAQQQQLQQMLGMQQQSLSGPYGVPPRTSEAILMSHKKEAYELLLARAQKQLAEELFEVGRICQLQVVAADLGINGTPSRYALYRRSPDKVRDHAKNALMHLSKATIAYDNIVQECAAALEGCDV